MTWRAVRSAGSCLALLSLVSCDPREGSGSGSLVLGAILPLTGPDAAMGQGVLAGMRLAAENGSHVTIQAVDGQGEPGPSARRFRELSREPAVRAIASEFFTTLTTRSRASISPTIFFSALSTISTIWPSMPEK